MTDMNELYEKFPIRLKQLREKEHLTQIKLAELIGTYEKMISKLETGSSQPTMELLVNISEHFNVSVDYLLFGDRDVNSEIKILLSKLTDTQLKSAVAFLKYLLDETHSEK